MKPAGRGSWTRQSSVPASRKRTQRGPGVRREIELAVRQAFVEARTLGAREAAARDEEQLAVESQRLFSQQYAAVVATSLDALAALSARCAARANLAAVRYARAQALVRLERATGILGEEGARGPIEAHP